MESAYNIVILFDNIIVVFTFFESIQLLSLCK